MERVSLSTLLLRSHQAKVKEEGRRLLSKGANQLSKRRNGGPLFSCCALSLRPLPGKIFLRK